MARLRWLLPLLLFALVVGVYLLWGRALALAIIEGNGPESLQSLVESLYPRLLAERHRLDAAYLLSKADQVFWRTGFTYLLGLAGLWLWSSREAFRRKLTEPFAITLDTRPYFTLLGITMFAIGIYVLPWLGDFATYETIEGFYRPVGLLKVIFGTYPGANTLEWLWYLMGWILMVQWATCWQRVHLRYAHILLFLVFVLLQGVFFSFEKTDHRFAPLFWILLCLAVASLQKPSPTHNGQWLTLTRLALAGQYLFSGLEKLFTSGLDWAAPATLRFHLLAGQMPLGLAIADMDWLLVLMATGTLLLQLGFISQLWWPRSRWWWIGTAAAFHIGSWLLLGIGDLFSPWMFALVFFMPWERK